TTHYDRTHVRVRVRVRGVAGHAAMASIPMSDLPMPSIPVPGTPMVGRSRRPMTAYAELHAHSAFSFLDGVSQPEELVAEAARLGLSAISITDHDGLYGVVRFAEAAQKLRMPTVYGAELSL